MIRSGRLRAAVLSVLVLIGLAILLPWLLNRWTQVRVTDARIAASVVTLSSESSGRVTAFEVVPGDRVLRGEVLVRIENRRSDLQLVEIDAEVARVRAEQSLLRAQQSMVRAQIESRREGARAQLQAAEAERRAAEGVLAMARSDHERVAALRRSGMITTQRHEEEQARLLAAQQQVLRASASMGVARAALAAIDADAAEVTVLERRIAIHEAQQGVLAARRAREALERDSREIRAAFDGVVAAAFVDVGEYVAPGTRLLMYHDPSRVWIDANVKETDFRRLSVGARASIRVDAYPQRRFGGAVTHLGSAATSLFSLLPSPNPSGNFTRITQRLPVRIAIEQDEGLLRPGMLVEVTIDVVD